MHTAAQNFEFSQVSSFEWHAFNVFESLVRWGVPVFVMISGALFLERKITLKRLFTKNILRLAESVAVFVFFKYNAPESQKLNRFVGKLSAYSFGVYLVHVLLIDLLKNQIGLNTLSFNPVLAVPCIAIIVCIVAFIISWLLNKIPVLNKYIV